MEEVRTDEEGGGEEEDEGGGWRRAENTERQSDMHLLKTSKEFASHLPVMQRHRHGLQLGHAGRQHVQQRQLVHHLGVHGVLRDGQQAHQLVKHQHWAASRKGKL